MSSLPAPESPRDPRVMSPAAPMAPAHHDHDHDHDDTVYPGKTLFIGIHLACFAAIWTGVSAKAVAIAITLYLVRMFGVTAGYHRYFSHRSFKTGRVMQFIFAMLAQASAQKGILWWAAKHRHHHRFSDTEEDVHSPLHGGFFNSHVGWIFKKQWSATDFSEVPDLTAYPELVWLNKYEHVPTAIVIALCFLLDGWTGFIVGFCWSTVATWHGTFMINSLAHVHGSQRYVTGDDSRNNWWLALITLGEGWHNNHHAYQRSTRQGFRWYEIDITYYVLKAMSWARLVWDLGAPPPEVVRNERPVGRAVLEKVARQLAESFNVEQIAKNWPTLPTVEEMRAKAASMLPATPSLDAIAHRAHEILAQWVEEHQGGRAATA